MQMESAEGDSIMNLNENILLRLFRCDFGSVIREHSRVTFFAEKSILICECSRHLGKVLK
jgi:hypothetical protein